ncbi:MAG: gliding motility protein GldM [Bacteroidales bacterium]
MGAKNCPETPRQKMISMMYIVLTAMLALNVSAEVLDAFRVVNRNLAETLVNVARKNETIISQFNQALGQDPEDVGPLLEKAKEVSAITDELVNYVDSLKVHLVTEGGGEKESADNPLVENSTYVKSPDGTVFIVSKPDELNVPERILVEKVDKQESGGTRLKNKIVETKMELIKALNGIDADTEGLRAEIEKGLNTEDPPKEAGEGNITWEVDNFRAKPLTACLTILTTMELQSRNIETSILNFLFSQIGSKDFKFNTLSAQVSSESKIILAGQPFQASIYLSAVDDTKSPTITVGGGKIPVERGIGKYKVVTSSVGQFKRSGNIAITGPKGDVENHPFELDYTVVAPSATISPTKMNVLYMGVPNPISISGGGVSPDHLRPTFSNMRAEKQDAGWVVFPESLDADGSKTKINVSANVDGSSFNLGAMSFRVKKVPDPVPMVANKQGGTISKAEFAVQDGILAVMKDFDFALSFTVTGFNVSITKGGFSNTWQSSNNRFTSEMKTQFNSLGRGDVVYIDNIFAKGGDGTTRPLPPISFKMQ